MIKAFCVFQAALLVLTPKVTVSFSPKLSINPRLPCLPHAPHHNDVGNCIKVTNTRNVISHTRLQASSLPASTAERNRQAINSIKAAITKPKSSSMRLLECEFPPLAALNKLGDGSLRSAKQAEQVNLEFAKQLLQSLTSPFASILGDTTNYLLLSSSASQPLLETAQRVLKKTCTVHSLRQGLPEGGTAKTVFVLLTPSNRNDYEAAKALATTGRGTVVLLNGFAKDAKSVPSAATMAYYLKPLTYNSQVAGILLRAYPQPWTTFDVMAKPPQVLTTEDDDEILVKGTNTPDLRGPGKAVQLSVDQRAIRARGG